MARVREALKIPEMKQIDWEYYYKSDPYKWRFIDAVKKRHEKRVEWLNSRPQGFMSPAVHKAYTDKMGDIHAEIQSQEAVIDNIIVLLDKETKITEEKARFLLEEKVNTILEEHPEWVDKIVDDIKNLRYNNPLEGTDFEEE